MNFKYYFFILLLLSIVLAQETEKSEIECSHAKSALSFITKQSIQSDSQNNYDVTFYDIDMKIDPSVKIIYGTVGVAGTIITDSTNQIDFDLSLALQVDAVKDEQGNDISFEHQSDLLSLFFYNDQLTIGKEFYFIIEYHGTPQSSGFGGFVFDNHNNDPMIWSLSEPYGARTWWPCKDTPLDKADSLDISLTVPLNLIAASNGLLVDTETDGDWTTYHWQERYPIATYLVSVAIHPYTVFYDWYKYSPSDSMRLEYYVFPDNYNNVKDNYLLTNDMIGAMAQRFSEYPFIKEKYGHAEFTWGGGMEHQTLSSMGGYSEGLIAHELAHQWWGDMVTCANFHHIWLNEGFATYSEALWYELRDNDIQSLHDEMSLNRVWSGGTIYVEDTTSVSRIFNWALTYNKASWVLHMLRHIVGDDDFFNGLREYGDRYRFKSAVTEQFQEVMEDISGMDLNYFFQRWIYGEFYPIYKVVYSQADSDLLIKLNQTQDSEVFEMPIDLRVNYHDGTNLDTVIHNTAKEEYFQIPVGNKTVTQIEIDPDNWILRWIESISLDTLENGGIIDDFILYPLYPNPFNSEVTIKFSIPKVAKVKIRIYDLEGDNIWSVTNNYNLGTHIVNWNGFDRHGNRVPSGTYLVEVSNDILVKSSKVLLLK